MLSTHKDTPTLILSHSYVCTGLIDCFSPGGWRCVAQNLFVFLLAGSGFWVLGREACSLRLTGSPGRVLLPRGRTRSARMGLGFRKRGKGKRARAGSVVRGGARGGSPLPPERFLAAFGRIPPPPHIIPPPLFPVFHALPIICCRVPLISRLAKSSGFCAFCRPRLIYSVLLLRSVFLLASLLPVCPQPVSRIARLLRVHVSCVLRIIYSLCPAFELLYPQQHLFNGAIFIKRSQNAEDMACARLLLSCSCFNGHSTVRYINHFSFIYLHEKRV